MFRYAICSLMLLVAACGSDPYVAAPNYSSIESEEIVAQRAIREYVVARGGPPNTQFRYVMEDMNNDGARDIVAMFELPYHYWCAQSGCTMMVLQAKDGGYVAVTEITSVYGPVVLTDTVTSGWRDIAVRASGTHLRDRDVALQFHGGSYPTNPLSEPPLGQPLYQTSGKRVFP